MSGSITNDPTSGKKNPDAAYDTGLFDSSRHDNQIVALYSTRADAETARDKLVAAGIDSGTVNVMDREADRMAGGVDYEAGDQGLWGAIKSLFAPDDEAHAYRHAVGKGHAMVVVTPTASTNRSQVIEVLESTDPVDFDAKLEEWRQAGYDGMAAEKGSTVAAPVVAAPVALQTGTAHAGTTAPVQAANLPAPATTNMAASRTGGTDTIKMMEERMRVGKREVAKGAVRVRSYVVERPVEEQVRLHEERISVERHPTDRAATPADATAFQERTIEATATSEEAVVSKEARVVEEIAVRKDVAERTETVRDTVRHTEVDVEDDTKRAPGTGSTSVTGGMGESSKGTMGTGGTTPNATPGATSSGMNSPRK